MLRNYQTSVGLNLFSRQHDITSPCSTTHRWTENTLFINKYWLNTILDEICPLINFISKRCTSRTWGFISNCYARFYWRGKLIYLRISIVHDVKEEKKKTDAHNQSAQAFISTAELFLEEDAVWSKYLFNWSSGWVIPPLGCVPLVPNVITGFFICLLLGDVSEWCSSWYSTLCGFCNFAWGFSVEDLSSVSHLHQLKHTDCYHSSEFRW